MQSTYQQLAAHFDRHFSDTRGGVRLEYLTGEQVISRLNEVLGPGNWTFVVREHGFDEKADEYWALGGLQARIDDSWVQREQFGSQKVKRPAPPCTVCLDKKYDHDVRHKDHKFSAAAPGAPLDIGFDLKGAATDALKKCATLIGVGLYLSEKEGGIPQEAEPPPPKPPMVQMVDVDDRLYKHYLGLCQEAHALGVEYETVTPPVPRQLLVDIGKELSAAVGLAKAKAPVK